jgi:16S rRNA processing protein RimM
VSWTDLITVGRVVRPHGNRGHVVVASETDFPAERFREGETVLAKPDDREPVRALVITAAREHQGRWVVGFAGFDSIDAAETLRNAELRIPVETLRPLDPGHYYLHDLTGCEVRTAAGERIGSVARVDVGAGVPMLVVAGHEGEVLVPFVAEFCRRVDVAAQVIEIDPPAGLIDLNRTKTGGPR